MKNTMFGEMVVKKEEVPDFDSFPAEISELTLEIAREAGLVNVLRIIEFPSGAEALAFVGNFWSGMKR